MQGASTSTGSIPAIAVLAAIDGASYDLASKVELSIAVSLKCETFAMNGMAIGGAVFINDYPIPDSSTGIAISGGLNAPSLSVLTSPVNLLIAASQATEAFWLDLYPQQFGLSSSINSPSVEVDQQDSAFTIGAALSAPSRLNASEADLAISAAIQAESQIAFSDSSFGLAIALEVIPFETGIVSAFELGAGLAVGNGWTSVFECGAALDSVSTPVEMEYSFLSIGVGLEAITFDVTTSETLLSTGLAISVETAEIPDSTTALQSSLSVQVDPIDLDSSIIQLTLGVSLEAIPEDFPIGDEFLLLVL